jgi:hypothetical protein
VVGLRIYVGLGSVICNGLGARGGKGDDRHPDLVPMRYEDWTIGFWLSIHVPSSKTSLHLE